MSATLQREESVAELVGEEPPLPSDRDHWHCCVAGELCLTVVVLGASGDLASKKTYPALQFLFQKGFLTRNTKVIGYARSPLTDEQLHAKLRPRLEGGAAEADAFLKRCTYVAGAYDGPEGWKALAAALAAREARHPACPCGRLYYLALPPSVYPQVCSGLKTYCDALPSTEGSWIRVIVEKPFGKDLGSSEELAATLGALYPENQLYRIDHYLGKEMAQNLFVMRFANMFLAPLWNRECVSNVQITFKEDFGTQGRGGYFDTFGIIRDVVQNHLVQLLAFVAMEKPLSIHPDDIRDEKVKVLRCIKPVQEHNVVLGQYSAAGGQPGYTEDPTVPDDSRTPTFAAVTLYIDNDRWAGVPFVLKAGKALNDKKAEIRVQMRATPHYIFPGQPEATRNELVVRLQPDEAIYLKMIVKKPGLEIDTAISELDLDYSKRYPGVAIPDAYPRLILDAIRGDQQHFVRRDELRAAWAIFTPLLHAVDAGRLPLHPYPYGSRGPEEADELLARAGFVKNLDYRWHDAPAGAGKSGAASFGGGAGGNPKL
ncbi:glucose-6-phosphate 1-cytoplasmic isoform [Micractinium conductrix]|uniref:Glucose-6-phosphate 1-dehydrogenase n=1 Tax=Micractinium conductrix TaxID=554055 RepID=A0A2P6V7R0_9CHLO|nr:glucose-6-phosphate 1-cytoplasmic isoform [Micractinium conductrix]|eukprot:PSC70121.1 glucose-6-phosphate 1-cytoplasmic isoform [Micractinium conductrix]